MGPLENSSTMVCTVASVGATEAYLHPGVDAVNTVLEVILFAGATNLGQGWSTFLTLFACSSLSLSCIRPWV